MIRSGRGAENRRRHGLTAVLTGLVGTAVAVVGPGAAAHGALTAPVGQADVEDEQASPPTIEVVVTDAEATTRQPIPAPFVVRLTTSGDLADDGADTDADGADPCLLRLAADADEVDTDAGDTTTDDTTNTTAATDVPSDGSGSSWQRSDGCDENDVTPGAVAVLGVIDGQEEFEQLLDQPGEVERSGGGVSIVFTTGRGLLASVPSGIGSGEVDVTFPEGCGAGAVAGGDPDPILLLIDAGACPDTERLVILLPDGQEYEIDAPEQGVERRGELDLTTEATGRGGPVTIRPPGSDPVPTQRGLRIAFSADDQSCGESDVNENSAYAVSLRQPCGAERPATVAMVGTDLTVSVELGTAPILGVEFVVPEGRRIAMGRAQADDASLAEGTVITVETTAAGTTCGTTTVQRDGAYLVLLGTECAGSGASLRATAPDGRSAALSLPDDGSPTVNLVFTTDVTTDPTGEAPAPVAQREDPLLSAWQVIVILSAILFVTLVALLVRWDTARRRSVSWLVRSSALADKNLSAADIKQLADAERDREPSFKPVFELALLGFVTVALVTLTLGGTLTEQGVLSILGAIVGYAAGRASSDT